VVGGLRSFVGLEAKAGHTLPVRVRVKPGIRYINIDLGRHRKRNGRKPIGTRTSNDDKIEREQNDQWKIKTAESAGRISPNFSAAYHLDTPTNPLTGRPSTHYWTLRP
jgi:hypothetical protein